MCLGRNEGAASERAPWASRSSRAVADTDGGLRISHGLGPGWSYSGCCVVNEVLVK